MCSVTSVVAWKDFTRKICTCEYLNMRTRVFSVCVCACALHTHAHIRTHTHICGSSLTKPYFFLSLQVPLGSLEPDWLIYTIDVFFSRALRDHQQVPFLWFISHLYHREILAIYSGDYFIILMGSWAWWLLLPKVVGSCFHIMGPVFLLSCLLQKMCDKKTEKWSLWKTFANRDFASECAVDFSNLTLNFCRCFGFLMMVLQIWAALVKMMLVLLMRFALITYICSCTYWLKSVQ